MLHTAEEKTHIPIDIEDAGWRYKQPGITYDHIPHIRQEMVGFLKAHGLSPAYTDKLALSLSEVLTNLIKHPLRKPAHVEITLEISSDGIVLDVADDASHFASFDAKCKDALSRLRCTETMAESGYGLGCILSQHTRVFYYPAGKAQAFNHFVIEDTPDRTTATWSPVAKPKQKPVIFLIDDDPVALKAEQRMLTADYDVVALSSATEAVSLYREQKPDLVISDLHMPGMNGISLRQELSTLDGGNATPFIFLSGVAEGANSPYISRMGIDDYLTKPVTAEKLSTTVGRLLTRHQQVGNALQSRFHKGLNTLLRPHFPAQTQGWRLTTRNSMAEAGGGDFTLYHQTSASFLGVLADVMGHGREAKFFAYAYAGYLRSLFRHTARAESAPADFLAQLSSAVADDDFLDTTLLTCQSFRLYPDGRIHISTAGHPPPIIIRKGVADSKDIQITGPLPGVAPSEVYDHANLQLSPGDKILFGTDGFFGVFDPEGYRREALHLPLSRLHDATADALADYIWQVFEDARRHHAHAADDATLVIAEFGGSP